MYGFAVSMRLFVRSSIIDMVRTKTLVEDLGGPGIYDLTKKAMDAAQLQGFLG